MKFQVPAFIQGIQTLKDKTVKLTVYVARELSGEEKAKMFDLEQKEGWFLFSENSFQDGDVPKEDAKINSNRKTPSQRLYNVLYVYWNQNYSGQDFNQWRESEMEKIIEDYKSKLI
jgi:hypothetical protein